MHFKQLEQAMATLNTTCCMYVVMFCFNLGSQKEILHTMLTSVHTLNGMQLHVSVCNTERTLCILMNVLHDYVSLCCIKIFTKNKLQFLSYQ